MDKKNNKAIVIGLDTLNGIQTARILKNHNISVIGIAKDPKHPFIKTNSCELVLFCNTSSFELIESLEKLGPTLAQKAVLFPCNDMNVYFISKYRTRLSDWFHIVLPEHTIVEMLMDKTTFYRYAQREGLPIPKTYFLNNMNELPLIVKEIEFPCVVKPPISAAPEWENQSKLKAYKVSSEKELQLVLERYSKLANILIIQSWISGDEDSNYSCNVYMGRNGDPLVTFVSKKIRQWPPITGEGCSGVEVREDQVLHDTILLFKSIQYHGLGYLEMKRDDRTGKFFIIEPNVGRPTGRSAHADNSGVELIFTMYCDALDLDLPTNRVQKYKNTKWIYIRKDFQSAFNDWKHGNLSLIDWARSLQGKKIFAIFSWSDLRPFIGDVIRSIFFFLKKEEREKRDYTKL